MRPRVTRATRALYHKTCGKSLVCAYNRHVSTIACGMPRCAMAGHIDEYRHSSIVPKIIDANFKSATQMLRLRVPLVLHVPLDLTDWYQKASA